MVLLPLIDIIIFIFIIICCIININKSKILLETDLSFDNQQPQQQQHLANNLRLTVEKKTCIKCYSKFLKQNKNLLQDTDPYTKLHARFFSHNLISSTRTSITAPDEIRKYSTASYENIPMMNDVHSHLRASYPCQITRSFLLNKSNRSQDFSSEQRIDLGRNSTNELILQTSLLKLKEKHSLCHLCYCLLLLFLFKYVLLTFPQHCIQMIIHLKQFQEYIIKSKPSNTNNSFFNNDSFIIICRFLFLFARFGDCLLLTRLPNLIKKYFPCWCHVNSKLLCKPKVFQRQSHQILMRNTDSSINERLSLDDLSNSNDLTNQQNFKQQRQSYQTKNCRFRLHFQFVPIWSKKRQRLFQENC